MTGLTLGDLTKPQQIEASRSYVQQVEADLGELLDLDRHRAEGLADYIQREVERIGGSDARLIFSAEDGSGPYCSWCWRIGGLCPHIAGGASEHVQKSNDSKENPR